MTLENCWSSLLQFSKLSGMEMQDFIVEEALEAADLVSSSQVPIPFLLVVKDGVGKAKDC